ncbi:hypothetical protein PENARI_c012G09138 [Penicillium arizonense]|uniref:Rhodanese domain-containing protein n=1 Tax=Penicillium arizonense TaxID=1835702 RepID=A0A1F5LF63_PENAI|nr:hypothetical protein PENARI_c012G09138 [Penicillium arizonense]OGE51863.1 hypothetical protein PENARI_c012G09138 [Penicillium arizonense]
MASTLSSNIRRSAITLSSATARISPRNAAPAAAFQRLYISASTRGLSTTTKTRVSLNSSATSCSLPRKILLNGKNPQVQTRSNSDDASADSLRYWGFEEINASLPASADSPTHKPKIHLIDVREPAELTGTGIIPSAVSIPLASQPDAMYLTPDEFETRFGFAKPVAEEGETMVFYCKAGVRAKAAAQLAVQAGYDPKSVGVYWGSWLDWEKNGGKVEKWDGEDY